jgi:acyl-CoA thioester hydrolase
VKRRRFERSDRPWLEAQCEVRVRFQEVDALRVVWHGHYLTYCEEGRNAFGRRYGFDYEHILANGCTAPLVHVELDFLRPARFDQTLRVAARMHEPAGARIDFSYAIDDVEGRPLAQGWSVQLFTDTKGELVLTRPRFFDEFLERWRAGFVRGER